MAEAVDIASVQDLMPGDDDSWNDQKVEQYLDSGKTIPEVMQLFWESRASKLYTMIDISESGSSRSMSRLYDNAAKQAEYWGSRVERDKEEAEKEAEKEDRRIRFGRITRV